MGGREGGREGGRAGGRAGGCAGSRVWMTAHFTFPRVSGFQPGGVARTFQGVAHNDINDAEL